MIKKLTLTTLIATTPITMTGCFSNEEQTLIVNSYGLDAYDHMNINERVVIEVEVTQINDSNVGCNIELLDTHGVSTIEKSKEIHGTSQHKIVYSSPSGFCNSLDLWESYFITFEKKYNGVNSFPQFGLVGNTNLDNSNWGYSGYFCHVDKVSDCFNAPNTEYDITKEIIEYDEVASGEYELARVITTEGTVVEYTPEDEYNRSTITIENNGVYLKTEVVSRVFAKNHNYLTSTMTVGNKYMIDLIYRNANKSGTGTESDPYIVNTELTRITERLN